MNGVRLKPANTAKYFGMNLDAKLDIKFRKMYWLLGKHSKLATYNKILMYKQALCNRRNHIDKT